MPLTQYDDEFALDREEVHADEFSDDDDVCTDCGREYCDCLYGDDDDDFDDDDDDDFDDDDEMY